MLTDSVASKSTVTNTTAGCGLDPDRLVAARKKLDAMGLSIKDWAEANGFASHYPLVRQVLAGNKRCLKGISHNIAVKLGLKDGKLSDV
jgi:gp16 family phage-associated protein